MNIFFTSSSPVECAKYLDDKRVVKMCLETAQMLSTAVRSTGIDAGYLPTHANHPSNVWARKSKQNFRWLFEHGLALCGEYTNRYSKTHKSLAVILSLAEYADHFPDIGLTPFANCAANKEHGISYKHFTNVHTAYQYYLDDRWNTDKRTPTWSGKG